MNHSFYDTFFEEYLTRIVLNSRQADGIDLKLDETLSLFAAIYEGDVEIYSQGSYAMGTTVRPLTAQQSPNGSAGEYDVDIVLERTSWTQALDALQSIRNVLSDEYADKLDTKLRESCERVHHSVEEGTEVGFHVDYVPISYNRDNRFAARRSKNEWFDSDTKQLVEWFGYLVDENIFLPAIILTLKRMRDVAGLTDTLSSIAITALVCNLYEDKYSYAEDLLNVLNGIIDVFNVPYSALTITIEPLEDDLAARIDAKQQETILRFFNNVRQQLLEGFRDFNLVKLRAVLSSSFPAEKANYPQELEALRRRGWGIETNGTLKLVEISETGENGSLISRVRKRFYGTGEELIFRANTYDKQLYGIRWQVLNAAGSPSRRGNLFQAKGGRGTEGSSSNDYVNRETESYDGEHWIKYYVYDKSSKRVVEIGEKFFVEVDK
jgi:hypothetical protein